MSQGTQIRETVDGVLVEVDIRHESQRVADGVRKIEAKYSDVEGVLAKIAQPFIKTFRDLADSSKDVSEAEVELGLAFEAEGGLVLVKAKGSANLKITLKLAIAK